MTKNSACIVIHGTLIHKLNWSQSVPRSFLVLKLKQVSEMDHAVQTQDMAIDNIPSPMTWRVLGIIVSHAHNLVPAHPLSTSEDGGNG